MRNSLFNILSFFNFLTPEMVIKDIHRRYRIIGYECWAKSEIDRLKILRKRHADLGICNFISFLPYKITGKIKYKVNQLYIVPYIPKGDIYWCPPSKEGFEFFEFRANKLHDIIHNLNAEK